MATGTILLPIGGAIPPDASASNAAPAIVRVKSSASAPSAHFLQANFDPATDEMLWWSFRMPSDYASAPVLKVLFKLSSDTNTAHNVRFEGRLAAVTSGDSTDVDAKALATTNSAGTTIPGTAGYLKELSITLTNDDSLAAGDFAIVYLRRDADGTTGTDDSTTGDCEVVAVSLEYTAA